MYRYGDPGKGYGYGVYGGLDGPEYCPPDDILISSFENKEAEEASFVVQSASSLEKEDQPTTGSSFIPEESGAVVFSDETVLPPTPCEDA